MRRDPQRDIDILDPAYQSVPMVGRDADLSFLLDWLGSEPPIAATALVGAAGSGKTRLALELLSRLPEDWQGGFLTHTEAKRFVAVQNLAAWLWQKPTLIVIDYAALFAGTLKAWFRELADHVPAAHPLRILLLERHADPENGWYRDLADDTRRGQAVRELFRPLQPRRVTPLGDFEQRRQVLASGLQMAMRLTKPGEPVPALPAPGADHWFDQRLSDNQWADPLLLLMAAVAGASGGVPQALSLARPDLAKSLAKRERSRIQNSVTDEAAGELLPHLYACATLCGGLSQAQAGEVADREFTALRIQYPGGPGKAVKDLAKLLGEADWLPPMVPDLLGEAFLLIIFDKVGKEAVERVGPVAVDRVAAILVRTAQDFGYYGERLPLEWLESLLAKAGDNLAVLHSLEAALPQDTVLLREFAVKVTELLIRALIRTETWTESETRVSQP